MLSILHWFIIVCYVLLPLAALVWTITRRHKSEKASAASFILTLLGGLILSLAMSLAYAAMSGGRVLIGQILLGAYFATGLLLILKLFDFAIRFSIKRLFRLGHGPVTGWTILRILVASILRVAVVAAIALPYIMSSAMTYRVKVGMAEDPKRQLGFSFERVEFRSTDGVNIVGWWIPAAKQPRRSSDRHWGDRTVLVCHGLGANKSNQLVMARDLVPAGFNVLAFDFRASGESGGQLTTFGDLERRDVLGAVRWLRETHAPEARRIFGVGASMGGAALIAAASDDSDEGRAISAVATYAAYDSLHGLAKSVTDEYFIQPLGWLLMKIGIPLASAQTGANLSSFSPGALAPNLWPRPLLVIHGGKDVIIPIEQGERLYEDATLPKYYLWIDKDDHDDLISDETASRAALEFFRTARPEPVI